MTVTPDTRPARLLAPTPSVHHWRCVIFTADLQPRDRHVALVLAIFADPRTLQASRGVRRLADDTGRGVTAVRRALRELRQRRLIIRLGDRPGLPDLYQLTIPADPTSTE